MPRTTKKSSPRKKPSTEGRAPAAPPEDPASHPADEAAAEEGEAREAEPMDGEAEVELEGPAEAVVLQDEEEDAFAEDDAELAGDGATAAIVRSSPGARGTDADERGSLERFDPLTAYLREVQRHPLLSPEETHRLADLLVRTGDTAAAATLVTSNLRLVVKIAYEYRRAYKNIMDLVQEGNIGLMQAVKRYDPYRGVKLSSYAAWWIRAYILRYILNNWRLVKLGTTQAQRKLFFNLRKKRAELAALGVDPSDAEVAKSLNVSEAEVTEMEARLSSSEKSLDAPVGDSDGRPIARVDMMPALGESAEAILADGEIQALMKEHLAEFRKTLVGKEKELAIFDERLVADDPLTLQELGDRFGISRERVRQLEQRLTSRLRDFLRETMGEATEVL